MSQKLQQEIFTLLEKIILIIYYDKPKYCNLYTINEYLKKLPNDVNFLVFTTPFQEEMRDVRSKIGLILNKGIKINNLGSHDFFVNLYYPKLTEEIKIYNQIIKNANYINLLYNNMFLSAKKEYLKSGYKHEYYFSSYNYENRCKYLNMLLPICNKIANKLHNNFLISKYFNIFYYDFTKDYQNYLFPYLDEIIRQYI